MDSWDVAQFKDLFLDEAQANLHTLNACLLALEQEPDDASSIDAMFRAAHSLKGSAAMMGYVDLAELAHGAEDVLHRLRAGEWSLTPSLVEMLFAAVDLSETLLTAIAADRPADVGITAMLAQLRAVAPPDDAWAPSLPDLAPPAPELAKPTLAPRLPEDETDPARMIRINVRHLDTLLNLVTEMVIHRSLLDRLDQRYKLTALNEALNTHHRHVNQLRDAVLDMRMVPLSQIFDRFPRMVRDLLRSQGKEAQFLVDGAQVEMDRMALEALSEPLVHLLRNAIDHGLEPANQRAAAGKTPSGTLRLSASREQDTVVIEVSDDGRGMDAQQIASVAVERGIVTTDAVKEMSQEDVLSLICHPGFSLSEKVTQVSGRGVGMNVVKQQAERLRGSLTISTKRGLGSTFCLKLPIKLSLMPAVLVRVGSETYALPMTAVEQIIEFDVRHIERLGEREVLVLGDQILPLRRLAALLGVPDAAMEPHYALLVRHDDQPLGLCVDAVAGYEEVVIKPLPDSLRGIPGLGGVTILGEGQTVIILEENLARIGVWQ